MDRQPTVNRRPGAGAPRFVDRPTPGRVNPYVERLAGFGPELIPAADAPAFRGRWSERFGRDAPLHVELGIGNGSWLAEMSAARPDCDWLGLEIRFKRCVKGATKLRGRPNAAVLRYSWFALDDLFVDGELTGIHLHHPDPWPAERQARHRLIDPDFCAQAARLLRPGGEFRLKTDFRPHVDALLAAIGGTPFGVLGQSDDVRKSGAPWPDEIVTGYQRKFDARGQPVYAVRLAR